MKLPLKIEGYIEASVHLPCIGIAFVYTSTTDETDKLVHDIGKGIIKKITMEELKDFETSRTAEHFADLIRYNVQRWREWNEEYIKSYFTCNLRNHWNKLLDCYEKLSGTLLECDVFSLLTEVKPMVIEGLSVVNLSLES